MFVGSKAPWFEIRDELPRFDAFPTGIDAQVVPDRAPDGPPGRPRGSCLCNGVAFVIDGPPKQARNCYCSRCRKARAASHASNLFVDLDGLRLTRGEDLLVTYGVPGARYFSQAFCLRCGSKLPRLDPERRLAIVPMGSLDDDPGMRPQAHIFVASKAPWVEITDELPRYEGAPPPA